MEIDLGELLPQLQELADRQDRPLDNFIRRELRKIVNRRKAPHFGQWLKKEIAGTGHSQMDFALNSNIKYRTLRNWIQAQKPNIEEKNLVLLANILQLTPGELARRFDLSFGK